VYTERQGLTDDHVAALFMDREDTLWVGTANQGLCRFRQGRFAGASGRDGLLADTIGTVIDDSLGNLWLGSNRGIVRVNRAELNDYLDGKQPRVAWRHFGLSDGLPTLGCTGGGQPASGRTADGRLWFATIKGAATVDPDRLSFNRLPPPVVIEEVVVDDQVQLFPGKGSNSITLTPHDFGGAAAANIAPAVSVPPRAQRIEFRFTGLSLMAAEQNRFRYRLDPFDDDWVQAGTRRVAYYTGLPAGSYQFRVTACNNDGVWNEDGVALGVTVLPPWWRTWWFQFLVALGVAGLVFGGYELRLFKLRRESAAHEEFSRQLIASQESERRRLAGELHDGMGQDLLVIASQAQLSLAREDNSAGATARLNEIAETARRAIHQARRMAHDLRPGLIEELGFTKAVRACADRAAQAAEIPLALQVADVDGLLSPEFEVNLFRMLQETLSNILKHARASELKVTLERRDSGLCLVVEDNGRGFDPTSGEAAAAGRRGFGMRQLAERAKLMGGRVDVQSQPGAGTRVTVEVPLDQSRDSR
jgi:signal transduction histidine kinase